MRVISGLYKGRILKTVGDLTVRPVTDRVKQTLFDMLANRIDLDGARVLDLFAGSGSLGIEALSRGAQHVTFVEDDSDVAGFIEKNLVMLGCEADADIIETDAISFVHRCRESFDLVFADPPYGFAMTAEIPRLIFNAQIVKPSGYLLIEHTKELTFEDTAEYQAGPEKHFGRTVVTFFEHPVASHEES